MSRRSDFIALTPQRTQLLLPSDDPTLLEQHDRYIVILSDPEAIEREIAVCKEFGIHPRWVWDAERRCVLFFPLTQLKSQG